MSDIVGQLRFAAKDPAGTDTHVAIYRDLCDEAATEVKRLRDIERILREELDKDHAEIELQREEVERLRAALRAVRDRIYHFPHDILTDEQGQPLIDVLRIIGATLSGKGES